MIEPRDRVPLLRVGVLFAIVWGFPFLTCIEGNHRPVKDGWNVGAGAPYFVGPKNRIGFGDWVGRVFHLDVLIAKPSRDRFAETVHVSELDFPY